MKKNYLTVVLLILFFSLFHFNDAWSENAQSDLTALSLEDLMDIKVYTPSKKPERILDTAAAITVITPEDIRRSGATSIPELLRMVPGISVQRIDSNSWDVSARGFTGSIYANKLLVMIDGRSVYNPLYGGVYWDVQDVVLEDIERIEVVRGPGGTLWGANAVNGVINVITKQAKDTQGTLVSAGAGTEERGFGEVRYGGQTHKAGEQAKDGDWFYRVYGKYFNRDSGYRVDDQHFDNWDMGRGGFRAEKEKWTVQGDIYRGNIGQRVSMVDLSVPSSTAVNEAADVKGWNLLTNYQDDDWSLQGYWDRTERDSTVYKETRDRLDLEYTKLFFATARQEIIWGLGSRLELEDLTNTPEIVINDPERGTDYLVNFFVQDEIKAIDDKLKFIIGSKLEYNIYTTVEVQPNVRVAYHINDKNQVWAAASRAIRTPTRIQTDSEIFGYSPSIGRYAIVGNRDLSSESLASYEFGYRNQPNKNMFFDLVAYANHYNDLITFNLGDTIDVNGNTVQTYPTINGMDGQVHGIELSGDIIVTDWWKIKTYYSLSKMTLGTDPDIANLGTEKQLEASLPYNTVYMRSSFDLPYKFELDTTVRYTDSYSNGSVPTSTEMDIVLGKTIKEWQISVVGQNLFADHHKESSAALATQIERSGYLKLTRQF